MHKKLTAALSAFIFSLILAFLAFSVSEALNEIHNQSFGIGGEYTRLSIPQMANPSPERKQEQEKALIKLRKYLADEKIIFISATDGEEGNPSVLVYDPLSTTWARNVKPSQTYVVRGSYSEELWRKKQNNPLLIESISRINGVIDPDASLQGQEYQFVHGLDEKISPSGKAILSTQNPEKVQHVQSLLSQALLHPQVLPRMTWKTALITHKEIDFTLLVSVLSIVACVMALNGVLEGLIPEFIIHTYSGGTALSITRKYIRHQFPTVALSSLAGSAFLLILNAMLQFARLNPFLLSLLLLSWLASTLIVELMLFLIVFSQLQVTFATNRKK